MADTVLVRHKARPESLVRLSQAEYDKSVSDAEELGQESPWVLQPEEAEGEGRTFDSLSEAEQAEVLQAQKERAEKLGL